MHFKRKVSATLNADAKVATDDGKGITSSFQCRLPGKITAAKVHVEIIGAPSARLQVILHAPSGGPVTLHNRQGGFPNGLSQSYHGYSTQGLNGREAEGVWALQVIDHSPRGGTAVLKQWKLECDLARDAHGEEHFTAPLNVTLANNTRYPLNATIRVPDPGENAVIAGGNMHVAIEYDGPFINDLGLALTSPADAVFNLNSRDGWWKRGQNRWSIAAWTIEGLAAQGVSGDWKLAITDPEGKARGRLHHWHLTFWNNKAFQSLEGLPVAADKALHHVGVNSKAVLAAAVPLEVSSILALASQADAVALGRRIAGSGPGIG